MLFTARATMKVNETSHVISKYFCLFSLLFHSTCSHAKRDSDKRQPMYYFNFLSQNQLTYSYTFFQDNLRQFLRCIFGQSRYLIKSFRDKATFTPNFYTAHWCIFYDFFQDNRHKIWLDFLKFKCLIYWL